MNDSIINILEDFEKFVYKLLMWVILIPKTILKVILHPEFVPEYIQGELKSEKGKQFDEYISPVLLYLGITLIPAVAIYLLPAFGMSLLTPQDDLNLYLDTVVIKEGEYYSITDPSIQLNDPTGKESYEVAWHDMEFMAEAVTKSDTSILYHRFTWEVWQCGTKNDDGSCSFDKFYFGEIHDEQLGIAYFDSVDADIAEADWSPGSYIYFPDRNSVSDNFYLSLGPGEYVISVSMSNFDGNEPESIIENYSAWVSVSAPSNSSSGQATFTNGTTASLNSRNEEDQNQDTLADRLQSGETITLGLLLLLPPLLLAVAISVFMQAVPSLGEENLKEHFYSQCYYLVPPGLAFWAWYYSSAFHTPDIHFSAEYLWVPLALAILWFIVVEVNALALALPSKSKLKAFLILSGCLVTMFVILIVVAFFSENYNLIREAAILSYPAAGILLTISILVSWYKKRKEKKGEAGGVLEDSANLN